MNKLFRKITVLFITVMIAAAIGCKKDSSDDPVVYGSEVYGTAAVGAPIIGTVNIKGADGRVSYSAIRADGSYTVDVSALVYPFVIYAEGTVGGESVRLYSTIDVPGRANVTPATNMVLALALGNDPEAVYPPADMKTDGVVVAAPDPAALAEAEAKVQEILENVFSVLDVPAGFDIMNGEFLANGTGFDSLLELVEMSVETDATGSVIVSVSDSISGTTYYEENATTGAVIADNTTTMATTITSSLSDVDLIKALCQRWGDYINTSDETARRAILNEMFAEDYLDEGNNKADSIDEEIADEDMPEGVTVTVSGVAIKRSVQDTTFTGGGTFTTTEARSYWDGSTGVEIPAGTTFTFNNGAVSSLRGNNAKAVQVVMTITLAMDGQSFTFTEDDYVVKATESSAWQFWGDRSLSENDFNTSNKKITYGKYDPATSSYSDVTEKFSGYSLWFSDEGNRAMTLGNEKFGSSINAILVTGEGMLRSYTNDGKKGMLLIRHGIDTDFRLFNNVQDGTESQNYCIAGRDLDVSQIVSTEKTVIAMHYDAAAKTFTPLYTWKCGSDSGMPRTESQLTDDMFPEFTNFSSTDIADYTAFDSFPWNLSLAWTAPSNSGIEFSFESLDYYANGLAADGQSWTSQNTEDSLLDGEDNDDQPTGYTFTLAQADTLIRDLRYIQFSLRYCDEADDDGSEFERRYILNKQTPGATVSGTITIPVDMSDKLYYIAVDNDTYGETGEVAHTWGMVTGTTINYSIPNVPAGTFYIYCVVYNTATTPQAAAIGDYLGFYGGFPPASAVNATVPTKGTVNYNFNAVPYTE